MRLTPKRVAPTLFVVHDGRRYAITQDEFLIGRSRATVHLTIRDGLVSRHHAAVIRRNGVHYLKDLGSVHGITYKGMRIDNKRIDEGDVFQIGDHELAFTFQDEK
jgi:pSer/pThr/pTyr-binding forkhead associated (FHA) protein